MKTLEVVLNNGTSAVLEGVVCYKETNTPSTKQKYAGYEVAPTPTVGKLFHIMPFEIPKSLFESPLSDPKQERTRQIMQEAFAEVGKYPEKYAFSFYTYIPKMIWDESKAVQIEKLKEYARDLGGEMADWVDQALEWAQRIFNGETWEAVCNEVDNTEYCRMIIWKNRYYRMVGSSSVLGDDYPASDVDDRDYMFSTDIVGYTVPLVRIEK